MGHAAGQLPHGFHFLGDLEALFQVPDIGLVDGNPPYSDGVSVLPDRAGVGDNGKGVPIAVPGRVFGPQPPVQIVGPCNIGLHPLMVFFDQQGLNMEPRVKIPLGVAEGAQGTLVGKCNFPVKTKFIDGLRQEIDEFAESFFTLM